MSTNIYNEGRVVGLSAYELYVRHQLAEYPELRVMSERAWLAASLGGGSSMILKVPKGSQGVCDFPLPLDSQLCAAKTIVATLFDGQVDSQPNSHWANKITSYGPLMRNDSSRTPITPGDVTAKVPYGDAKGWAESYTHVMREYVKITDGLVYQPGTWTDIAGTAPAKDFTPDYNKPGCVRLYIESALTEDVLVLFSGFMHRSIVAGISMIDSTSLTSPNPQNGDFIGPEVYPWASRIIFTVSSQVLSALNKRNFERQLPTGQAAEKVADTPVIDFETTDPKSYYGTGHSSQVSMTVTDINTLGTGAAVLATYQKHSDYPPALYGAKVAQAEGTAVHQLCPIDIAAPGSVKIFENDELAINYPKQVPNTFAMYKDADGDLFLVNGDELVSLSSKVEVVDHASSTAYAVEITSGDVTRRAVSLQDKQGADLPLDGAASTAVTQSNTATTHSSWINAASGLNWAHLLSALKSNKLVDVLGSALRTFRSNLPNIKTSGVLDLSGTGQNKLAGSLQVTGNITTDGSITANGGTYNANTDDTEFKFNKPVKSGSNYIVFENGTTDLRLYIGSGKISSLPTNGVPVGSIAIGYVE